VTGSAVLRLPVGAEPQHNGKTHVRVWAPAVDRVHAIVTGKGVSPLTRERDGYFSGVIDAAPGDRYQFRLGDDDRLYPDPASRYQPEGPHGPSQVVDAAAFRWTDEGWAGVSLNGQVVYELHVGTFTPEGTYASAAQKLRELAAIGVTMVEMMPIAEFDGRFGWGYDGVDLFAPFHGYGEPDDLRRFVDVAHAQGVAVILDVVYNHFGPSGNYLRKFSGDYFSTRYENEWGDAINFDGPNAGPVREFFVANARYWIDEFHFDGLRLDATQQIFDGSDEHVLAAIGREARRAAGTRSIVLIAENEPQDTRLVKPREAGGYGLDGLWNDDLHHSAMVALTGHAEAYYTDTRGEPQEFVSAAKYGYLFQGQQYAWQRKRRGAPAWGIPAWSFIGFLQNHDQVANSGSGARGHRLTSPARWRAMTALLLLGPWTPMLFQGQEFESSSPFLYFADFDPELARAVRAGRDEFLRQFPSLAASDASRFADPAAVDTFEQCRLDWRERETHHEAWLLHRDLLRMRREVPAFAQGRTAVDGAVLGSAAFALRFFTADHSDDRVLLVNLGRDVLQESFAEPLLAPPAGADWSVAWSSGWTVYGGNGLPDPWPDECWRLHGETATVLEPGTPRERVYGPRRRTA
jgi:maltooligosyltrehalose trehalohydrolase